MVTDAASLGKSVGLDMLQTSLIMIGRRRPDHLGPADLAPSRSIPAQLLLPTATLSAIGLRGNMA